MNSTAVLAEIQKEGNPDKAKILQKYFKTGKGDYGEGDLFLGLTVPQCRKIAARFRNLSLAEVNRLLQSPIHESRVIALMILVSQFQKASAKKEHFRFYLRHIDRVNNWDLVDGSAPHIVGGYLFTTDRNMLDRLARSRNLWRRRIAIISTYYFIKKGQLDDTFRITEALLNDREDLIHKATGWMLREAGKVDGTRLEEFLKKHHARMPRTMLRYAIERFPEKKRKSYLAGKV